MFVKDVQVQNQVGLHARPATFFIQKANEFKSSIWVEKDERRVNAKSLLGVLSLGIVGGTTIRIIADGADAVSYTHLDVYKRQVSGYKPCAVPTGEPFGGRTRQSVCSGRR